MYYDTYRGKKGRRRRRPRHLLLKFVCFVLALAVIAAAGLYILPVSFINTEKGDEPLHPRDGLPSDRINVLLLGLDFLKDGRQRADAILIASVGMDSVRLTSVQRDLEVDIPGHGRGKINAAYNYGGAEAVVRILNDLLELNMTRYVVVDFMSIVDIVDAVGGIELEILTSPKDSRGRSELDYLNSYGARSLNRLLQVDPERYARYTTKYKSNIYAGTPVYTQGGTQKLDGLFALAYSRIRYIGTDIGRANRHRKVLNALARKMRSSFYDPGMYVRLLRLYGEGGSGRRLGIHTNLSVAELISLGEKLLIAGNVITDSEQHIPYEEYKYDQYTHHEGSNLEITDRSATIRRLRSFLYG